MTGEIIKNRIKELENALADLLTVIPNYEVFSGVAPDYLETVADARKVLRKKAA
jgi:hypothetical protein